MTVRDAFCSFCGAAFDDAAKRAYPRSCGSCSAKTWANPIPVSVVLVPIEHPAGLGLLVVRRGIEPGKGRLALVGGFLEAHETWQQGGVREVREETGVEVDAGSLAPLHFASTSPRPNHVLLFSVAPPRHLSRVAPFAPNAETLERGVVFGPGGLDDVFAFPLHAEAARRYFAREGVTDDHAYVRV